MGLVRFVAGRLASTLAVLAVVAVVVFLLVRLTGDPAALLAGDNATPEQMARIRESLGLTRPLPVQFGLWCRQVLGGDLGASLYYRTPVTALIGQHLEPTAALAVTTMVWALLVAIPLGVVAAWRQGGWLDRTLMSASTLGFSVPVFVVGYVLVWVVALKWRWLPVQGYGRLEDGLGEFARHIALPALTLSVVYIALLARTTRAAVAQTLTEDYVKTARAKGLPEWQVLVRHALVNATAPIITVIGVGLALLLSGAVVTERVFAIPGLGSLMVGAVEARDFPVVQGVILLFACTYVLVNLLIDVSYAVFDPRIRY